MITSFNAGMQSEKIAVIALVVIIVGALSAYSLATYGEDIFNNLFGENKEPGAIALGDCADVHYIGKYASNGTVFDSSYEDVENKTGGMPLNIFVSLNKTLPPPSDYFSYLASPLGMIEGFIPDLVDMKENDTATIGPIPPEKAYGAKKLGIGDTFSTINLALEMNQTVQVIDLTSDFISLKWINVETLGKFTMPQMILKNLSSMDQSEMIIIPPPHSIWENSTEIINITDETVTVKTTPTVSENLSETLKPIQYGITDIMFIFPDATTATWNETTITITSSPEIGASYQYSQDTGMGYVMNMTFIIESIVNDTINISVMYEDSEEKIYQEVNSTLEFDRIFTMPRVYNNIPLMYQEYLFAEDIQREGYSLHELAGESLIFEVEIVKVYKTSQEES
jgi:FKBP-type peptidyl-prolyl cis-trans isomerase 2